MRRLLAVRRRPPTFRLLAVLVTCAAVVFVFDLSHLWYAGADALRALGSVVSSNRPVWERDFTVSRFVFGQIDTFRRYFTHVGLISMLLVGVCLARPHTQLSRRLFAIANANVLKRVLAAAGAAALGYVLAAPSWAMTHQYWQFYFLPVVVTSIVLLWELLRREIVEHPTRLLRVLRVMCILDVLISSAYWLHFRHTRVEAYAVQATATLRSTSPTTDSEITPPVDEARADVAAWLTRAFRVRERCRRRWIPAGHQATSLTPRVADGFTGSVSVGRAPFLRDSLASAR